MDKSKDVSALSAIDNVLVNNHKLQVIMDSSVTSLGASTGNSGYIVGTASLLRRDALLSNVIHRLPSEQFSLLRNAPVGKKELLDVPILHESVKLLRDTNKNTNAHYQRNKPARSQYDEFPVHQKVVYERSFNHYQPNKRREQSFKEYSPPPQKRQRNSGGGRGRGGGNNFHNGPQRGNNNNNRETRENTGGFRSDYAPKRFSKQAPRRGGRR